MAGKTVNPTRMELTRLKGRLKTARRGHKLLKDKRDELMKQFLEIVRRNRQLRAKVEQGLKEANDAFTVAAAVMGPEMLEQSLLRPQRSVSLDVDARNIMSVNVPVFTFHTEGGDVLNINEKTLAVGISQRTQAAAIDVMAQNIFWNSDSKVERILAFDIPVSRAFMHLDTVFTQIDVDKFTIHPAIMGTLRVYELTAGKNPGDVNIRLIEDTLEHVLEDATGVDQVKLIPCGGGDPIAASREQWNDGSNTLCVEPGKSCVYARNTVTNDVLYKEGLDLLVVPSAELSRGRGGPRCMSMPFWREDL